MAVASIFASLPLNRLRRFVSGARISSAARARLIVSGAIAGSGDVAVEISAGEVCERVGGGGLVCAGVSEGVIAPWYVWCVGLSGCFWYILCCSYW